MSDVPRLFRALRRRGTFPRATGVVHDFCLPRWGHNISILAIEDEGRRLRVACWVGRLPGLGDWVILRGVDGESSRYRVLGVEPAPSVGDMYFLDLLFDPRTQKGTGGTDAG